jgi:molecular chaperone DnaK
MAFLGIDLGTTNSVGVIYDDKTDELEIVMVDFVDEVLPSVVSFIEDEVIVGTEAKNSAIVYPEETILSIKRKMGESEPITVQGQEYLPEEISSIILKKILEAANEQASEHFEEVVITHPAYFNDRQVYATKRAGELAGFKKVHLLSEPLSAAIEYAYKQGYGQTLLVYDFGGGTFDACVLQVNKDAFGNESFIELADVGDMNLGGDDFDQVLVDYMIQKFQLMTSIDINDFEKKEYQRIIQKLKQEAEQLKKKLSSTNKATVKISPLVIKEGIPYNLTLEVTKDDFEALIREYIEKSREIVEEALKRANKEPDDISKVILVGGSTLIPMVKRMIAGFIKEPYRATDPAKSVAMGAAIYNYLIHLPHSNVKIEQITRQTIGTSAIVNTETMTKELIPIIPMGAKIPVKVEEDGFTLSKGSNAVRVDAFQWEEGHEEERKYIGSLVLEGVSEKAKLSLTYSISEDNLFEVVVKDQTTDKEIGASFDRTKNMPKLPEIVPKTAVNGMNIVFLIDTTSSMDTFIDGVKEKAITFSNILKDKGIDYQLGLIGFGDLKEREKPKVYKFTEDILKFQKRVKHIPRTCGGDLPESSLDALETGVLLLNKSKIDLTYKNVFILITDAPPHLPTESGKGVKEIKQMLEDENIKVYIAARKDTSSRAAYSPLVIEAKDYYSLDDDFYDILDDIAYSIAELVKL